MEKNNFKNKILEYYFWLPIVGIILVPTLSIYYYVYLREIVSFWSVFSICIPFLTAFSISLPFYIFTKTRPPFFNKLWICIISLIIIITGVLIYSYRDNHEIPKYQLHDTKKLTENNNEIILIYSSDNCKYCIEMKKVFHRFANYSKEIPVIYVNLTDYIKDKESGLWTSENGIKVEKIPTVIKFRNGIEEKRIVGVTNLKELKGLLKK